MKEPFNMTTIKPHWYAGTCGPRCGGCSAFVIEHAALLAELEKHLPADSFAVSVDQTGGHTMCIRVSFLNQHRPQPGFAYITDAEEYFGEGRGSGYMLGVYPNDEHEGEIVAPDASFDEVVKLLRQAHA